MKLNYYPNTKYKYIGIDILDMEHFLEMRSFRFSDMIDKLVKYIDEQVKEEDF